MVPHFTPLAREMNVAAFGATLPELQDDPDNKRPSHAGSNRERGNGAPVVDLGIPSRQWE
jgi:hypothetical protein